MKEVPLLIGPLCPECNKGQLLLIYRSEEFDVNLGEEKVRVKVDDVPVEKCDQCGQIITGPSAAKLRHDATCRAAGFYTPAEIHEMREKFGLSQSDFASLMGVGTETVSRWERGRLLQNRSNNNLMLLLKKEENRRILTESAASHSSVNPSANGSEIAPQSHETAGVH